MKVSTFTTRLIQLYNYLSYFLLDCVEKMVTALPHNEVKEILYYTMTNTWRKKITEQGYYYLHRSIHEMIGFYKTRIENLETPASSPSF